MTEAFRGRMRPIERLAAFKAAVTLADTTVGQAAAKLGVSYNHLRLVLRGERIGSRRLERDIAAFIGEPVTTIFGSRRNVDDEVDAPVPHGGRYGH